MKSSMVKSTLREIKGSFGRWFAIMAIAALGVGFFSGLKVCKAAFTETGNQYLDNHKFYDFQLLSTLGLEDEDVNTIKDSKGVKYAEGAYSADVLISLESGKQEDSELSESSDDAEYPKNAEDSEHTKSTGEPGEIVSKFHTLSENINTPSLEAGKLPEKGNQCLADANYFTKDDIGKEIKVSSDNVAETSDMLAYNSYTITGIADFPLYLNFERGTASIGDGKTDCFLLIPKDGWDSDIYTEIYVKLNQSAYIFSDEYDKIASRAKGSLEKALESCSERRYNQIIDEAKSKLAEAEEKVVKEEKALNDGEIQLAVSQTKLDNGKEQLKDAQEQLDKLKAAYDKGIIEYEKQKSSVYEYLEELYDTEVVTSDQYKVMKDILDSQLASAWEEIQSLQSQLDESQAEIDRNRADIQRGEEEIKKGRRELDNGRAKIEDAKAELKTAQKEIDKIEHPDIYVLGRDTNIGYVCFENDTSIVEGIAKVFPIFFFLVAALVCMTTMSRMIDEQRTQIGVLKALGYSKNQILSKYIFYSGSSAVIGGIIGFFGGTYLFTWVIWEAYGMMYGFSDVIFVHDWLTGGLALIAAIICSVGTTLYSCYHEFSQVPAELIRPKAPAAGKRIFLERLPFIWNRLKFLHKVSARNIFRYKKRFFMMVLGICGCTALLVTGLGIRDSIKNVVATQYGEIYHVDYSVTFNKSMSPDNEEDFLSDCKDIVDNTMFLYTSTVEARSGASVKSVNLVAASESEPISDFIDLHNDDGKLNYPKSGEGIINSGLADILDIEVGDDITVYDSEQKEITVNVTGICDNYVYNYLYINDETFADIYGEMEINSAYIIGKKSESGELENPHRTGEALMNASHVSAVSVTSDFKERIDNMMISLDYVIALVVLCAGALAFIVLYNLTNINITERIREIATIKVLGFYPRETSSYVFRENVVLTAISAIIGLPLGTALHAFVMSQIKIDLLTFDVHIEPLSYLIGVVGTFAFAMIVNVVMYYKINKISMTESLKSIE